MEVNYDPDNAQVPVTARELETLDQTWQEIQDTINDNLNDWEFLDQHLRLQNESEEVIETTDDREHNTAMVTSKFNDLSELSTVLSCVDLNGYLWGEPAGLRIPVNQAKKKYCVEARHDAVCGVFERHLTLTEGFVRTSNAEQMFSRSAEEAEHKRNYREIIRQIHHGHPDWPLNVNLSPDIVFKYETEEGVDQYGLVEITTGGEDIVMDKMEKYELGKSAGYGAVLQVNCVTAECKLRTISAAGLPECMESIQEMIAQILFKTDIVQVCTLFSNLMIKEGISSLRMVQDLSYDTPYSAQVMVILLDSFLRDYPSNAFTPILERMIPPSRRKEHSFREVLQNCHEVLREILKLMGTGKNDLRVGMIMNEMLQVAHQNGPELAGQFVWSDEPPGQPIEIDLLHPAGEHTPNDFKTIFPNISPTQMYTIVRRVQGEKEDKRKALEILNWLFDGRIPEQDELIKEFMTVAIHNYRRIDLRPMPVLKESLEVGAKHEQAKKLDVTYGNKKDGKPYLYHDETHANIVFDVYEKLRDKTKKDISFICCHEYLDIEKYIHPDTSGDPVISFGMCLHDYSAKIWEGPFFEREVLYAQANRTIGEKVSGHNYTQGTCFTTEGAFWVHVDHSLYKDFIARTNSPEIDGGTSTRNQAKESPHVSEVITCTGKCGRKVAWVQVCSYLGVVRCFPVRAQKKKSPVILLRKVDQTMEAAFPQLKKVNFEGRVIKQWVNAGGGTRVEAIKIKRRSHQLSAVNKMTSRECVIASSLKTIVTLETEDGGEFPDSSNYDAVITSMIERQETALKLEHGEDFDLLYQLRRQQFCSSLNAHSSGYGAEATAVLLTIFKPFEHSETVHFIGRSALELLGKDCFRWEDRQMRIDLARAQEERGRVKLVQFDITQVGRPLAKQFRERYTFPDNKDQIYRDCDGMHHQWLTEMGVDVTNLEEDVAAVARVIERVKNRADPFVIGDAEMIPLFDDNTPEIWKEVFQKTSKVFTKEAVEVKLYDYSKGEVEVRDTGDCRINKDLKHSVTRSQKRERGEDSDDEGLFDTDD